MAGADHDGHPYHFKLFGFPVHVGWQFFLVSVLVASNRDAVGLVTWVLVVFVSVLVHELGHAFAYRAFGASARIRLWGMGGLTYGDREPRHRWQDAVVSLAGPVPPLLLIGLPALVAYEAGAGGGDVGQQLLLDIWWANLFWSVVNLLPILPMDGGRLADTLFGRRVARIGSVLTALGAGTAFLLLFEDVFYFVVGLLVAGYNTYALVQEERSGVELRSVRRAAAPARAPKAEAATPAGPDAAWIALDQRDLAQAAAITGRLGPAAPTLLSGAVLAAQGRPEDAVAWFVTGLLVDEPVPPVADRVLVESGLALHVAEVIARSGDGRGPDSLARFHARLRDRGHVEVAARVGELHAGLAGADAGAAWYDVARTWARAGDPARTTAALEQSARHGHARSATVVGDPSFSPMYEHPGFAEAVAQLDALASP